MKYLKIIGLAALAIMAMTAVAATSASASAKVCSTAGTGESCGAGHGNVYTGKIVATSTKVTLTATNPDNTTVTCTDSVAEGEITNGATGTGKITGLTFTGCSSGFCTLLGGKITASSTVTAASSWPATATKGTAPNGTMDVTITKTAGKFVCSAGALTCEYSAADPQLTINGSDTAPSLVATNVALTKVAGPESTCGTSGDWSGTYAVTTPSSLFIT